MAGSLIKIDEEIVTSAVASVTLGTSNWDSSYDVYMVKFNKVLPDTDGAYLNVRFTKTSDNSVDSSANYDRAVKLLKANTSFSNTTSTNATAFFLDYMGTAGNEQNNGILYLFNFNNASEYSFLTCETTERSNSGDLRSYTGGGVLTVAQATNGISFFPDSGNFDNGTFTLYGLKK